MDSDKNSRDYYYSRSSQRPHLEISSVCLPRHPAVAYLILVRCFQMQTPNVSSVVIETEVAPAISVERDAVNRLGQRLRQTGRPLLSAIAVRLPR